MVDKWGKPFNEYPFRSTGQSTVSMPPLGTDSLFEAREHNTIYLQLRFGSLSSNFAQKKVFNISFSVKGCPIYFQFICLLKLEEGPKQSGTTLNMYTVILFFSNFIVVGYGRRLIRIKRTNTYVTNFYSCNPL